ncbi:MAG: hypothetical protein LW884_02740 [Bacteroidetes bacterium]|jgi:glutamyl-tRNA reductase|nr:hypothetical protein [Bacteroidota bacterium]
MKELVGIEVKYARLEPAQRAALAAQIAANEAIRPRPNAQPLFVLSTCSRFVAVGLQPDAEKLLLQLPLLQPYAGALDRYQHTADTLAHLVAVVAGLRSPLLGEYQIVGQYRAALATYAEGSQYDPALLHHLQHALRMARKLRRVTPELQGNYDYAQNVVSILHDTGYTASSQPRILLLGTGNLAGHIRDGLAAAEYGQPTVATHGTNADKPHPKFGRTVSYQQATDSLPQYEVVIGATKSQEPLISTPHLNPGKAVPRLWIDLGFPSNFDLPGKTVAIHHSLQDVMTYATQAGNGWKEAAEANISTLVQDFFGREQRKPLETTRNREKVLY